MIPQKRKYIFIIVHYGSPVSTDDLLTSLLQNNVRPDKLILIDHAVEKYVAPLSAPELHIFRPNTNDGYSAGLNIGLGSLLNDGTGNDDIVICMNNDVSVRHDFLSSVKKWWQDNPARSLMGIKEGSVNFITGRASIHASSAPYTMSYLHGSFVSAPYEVFASLHGWPDKYFLYWEDVLMSRRAKKKKIPLRLSTTVSIDHDDEKKVAYSDDQLYYLVRNGALFLEEETSWLWRKVWWLVNRGRLIWHKHVKRGSKPVVVEALHDASQGRTGKRSHE